MLKFNEKDRESCEKNIAVKSCIDGPFWDGGVILLKPQCSLGEHWHAEIEETFYVISGSAKLIVDLREYEITAGDIIKIVKGERHEIINTACEELKLFNIRAPFRPKDKYTI